MAKEKWYPGKYAKEAVKKVKETASKVSAASSRRRLNKLAKEGKVKTPRGSKVKEKMFSKEMMKKKAKVHPGSEKTGKVSRGAVGAVQTKGGTYAKYKKDSKAAGDFRSAFADGCKKGAKTFSWQGRSYSCAKK